MLRGSASQGSRRASRHAMRRTDARANGATRRATDELLLARLLGVEEQRFASADPQADEQLLHQLLLSSEPPAAPHRHMRRIVLLAVAAMLAVFACAPLASAVSSLLAIRRNVAAMQQPATARIGNLELTGRAAQGLSRSLEVAASPSDSRPISAPSIAGPHSASPARAPARQQSKSAPPAADAPAARAASRSDIAQPPPAPVEATRAARPGGSLAAAGQQAGPQPSAVPPVAPEATSSLPSRPEAAISVLLLGVDRRPGQTGPARADSVIVARIDPQAGRVALVSLPRDLQVEIPGVGWDRINSTTVYGDMYPELGGGLDLSRRTVELLLSIPIDHAVSVDFSGFISAVDALGGITVDVEREVYDSFTENYFAAGPQHMDGRTALWYSRIRFLDSDFERMRRQQAVLLGLLSRIRQQNALQQLHSIAAVTGALRGYIQTDLPEDRMVRLAWGLRNIAPEAVEQYRLEADQVDIFVNAADPYAQYLRPGAVESLVRKLLGPRINE